jgi:hypothetical protein
VNATQLCRREIDLLRIANATNVGRPVHTLGHASTVIERPWRRQFRSLLVKGGSDNYAQ